MAKQVKDASVKTSSGKNLVSKTGNTVYVSIDPDSVVKYVRAGNDLVIHQKNGQTIRISGFFTADDAQKLNLVYRHDGQEWPVTAVKATIPVDDAATGNEVDFVAAGGSQESELNPLIIAGLAAAGLAAAGKGGSGGGGGGKEAPPPAPPVLESKSNPDGTVTATGTALAGSRVTVTFPDGTSKIVTAGADGKYTATSETAQPSGKVNAVVTDNNGKTSLPAVKDYVDNVAPKSPEAVSVMDEVGAVTGKIKANDLTDDARPVMSGKAEAGSTVTIYDGAVKLGTTIADAAGNWTFRPATALAEGEHKITFTATDKAGNTSPATEPLVFKVDTVAPPVPVLKEAVDSEGTITGAITASGVTDDTRPEFKGEGAEAGTTIRFFDNGVEIGSTVVDADGKWSFTPEIGLQQGVHRITMQAQDIAGNKSEKSETFQFEVDTTPPTAPLVSEIRDNTGSITGNITTGATTDETKPTLTGSGAEAGSTVKIYDKGVLIGETTADSKGTWTFTPTTDLAEGEHVFTVTATDKAGNEGISSPSWTVIVDTTAPEQPTIALVADAAGTELDAGAITSERRPILSGEAEAGSTVTIYDNGKKLGTVVAEDDGTWSFELKSNLAQGEHTFTIKATDAAGNESEASDPFGLTVDSIAPLQPEITSITDAVGDITGALALNAITDDARPVLAGKAEAGTKVTIYDQGVEIGTVTADANGTWTYTPDADLSEGGHSFSVTATDAAGNVSPASKGFTITVDTVAPDAPQFTTGYDAVGPVVGEFNSGGIINDNRPKLSGAGAEPNAKVIIYQYGVAVATVRADVMGQWSWKSTTALTDGSYSFTATVTDTAGNVSAASNEFMVTVDTVAPNAPVIELITDDQEPITGTVDKGGFTNDTMPTLSGSGAEAGGTVRIYDGATLLGEVKADADGKWSFTPENALGSGVHSFTVVAVDAAGNVSAKSDVYSVTVDTLAPNAPVITQVLDDVGSVTGAVANGKTTDDTKPTLSGSGAEAGSTVNIYDNGALIGETVANANGTWSFTPDTELPEGAHFFTVTATDAAGNEGSASMPWVVVVDTTPPDASFKPEIISASDGVMPVTGEVFHNEFTNDTNPRLNGKGAEPSGFIRIYEGTTLLGQVQADENGNWTFDVPTRPDGSHSFIAKTVDEAGNEGSSSDAFTLNIDTKAPLASDAVITEVLDAAEPYTGNITHNGLTNDARPVISGTAVDGVTLVRIYDGTTLLGEVSVSNGEWSFKSDTDLSNGAHNFRIKAVDAAGNEGPYSPTWSVTVDTTAPNAPSITAVQDDQGSIQGNVGDGKTTDDRRPTLSGGSAEAGSTVKIYDKGVLIGETKANDNGIWSFTPATDLAEGSHVFTVTATDKAGNEGVPSASFSVTVDTVAPEQPTIALVADAAGTELDAGAITSERRPILSGEAEAGSTVTIYDNGKKLGTVVAEDDGTWSFELKSNLAQGEHTFTIKATDAAGNESDASDPFGFTVDSIAPALPEITSITDAVGSITGSIKANGITDDARPVLAGKAEAGSTVTIYDYGEAIGTVTADANGTWTYTPDADLSEGGHSFSVTATDAAGNVSPASKGFTITVDTVAPDAPQFTTGYDAVGPVVGEFNSGGIINDNRPKLSGAGAEPNAVVHIYKDGVLAGTVKADAGGQWSWKSTTALTDGSYSFTATVTDTAGNVSAASEAFTVTVDTVAPDAPVIELITDDQEPITGTVDKGGFTNDTMPTLSGSGAEANGTVRIYDGATLLGEVKADADGKWSFTPENALGSGVHSFTVVVVDAAGNVSAKSDVYSVTVDTLAPNAPVITQVLDDVGSVTGAVANGKTTDDTKPTLSGSGAEAGSTVNIYDNGVLLGSTKANANGTWSFTPNTELPEGAHSFTVTATDKAGNESSASMPWVVVVDTTPPDASFKPEIISASDDVMPVTGEVFHNEFTNDTNPRLNGKGAEPSGFIRIYEGTTLLGQVQADENGNWTFDVPTRPDGSHSFIAKTVDEAGNEGSSSDAFTLNIDTKAPLASDAVITEVLDAAEPYTGNITHNGLTNDARPVISGTAVDGVTLVRIYDGTTLLGEVSVSNGEWSFKSDTDLSNGAHNFRIKAVDAAGNEGPYSPTWSVTVDTTAPNAPSITAVQDDQGSIQGNVGDGKTTDDRRPTLSGGSAEAGSTVKIYDKGVLIGETKANDNGIWSFTPATDLAEGSHVFTVTATDKAGNEGVPSASFSVTVDTVAPDQPSIVKVMNAAGDELSEDMITSERRPILSGEAEAGSTVTIYDNGKKLGTVIAEDDGTWSFELKSNLAQGEHTFTIKATDAAGNESDASDPFGFTVDSIAPALPEITSITDAVGSITGSIKANGITDDARPVLAGKAEAGSTVTIYDYGEAIGTVTADANGTWTYTLDADLSEGGHSFSVTATDAAGNVSPASKGFTITVDTVAPDAPQFTTGYDAVGPVVGEFNSGGIINDNRPKLSGAGAEPNAVVHIYKDGVLAGTVKADAGGQWSWKSTTALVDGTHVFTATETDTAGNVSAASNEFTVTVDTVAPDAPVIELITDDQEPITGTVDKGGFTNDTTPTLSGSGAEANGTVRIYDGATLLGEVKADADGKWSFTPENALGSGVHSFTVVAVDAAGNVSAKSDVYSVTVDTLAPNAPVITQVLDDVGSVTGAVANGKTTDDTKPTLSGSGAEAGSTVNIYDNGVLLGSTKANANGTWSFTPTTDLSEGTHSFTVTATDAAGNEGSASMPWAIVVDTTPPDASFKPEIINALDDQLPVTGSVGHNEFTNDTTPRLIGKGAEPNGFIRIYSEGKLLGQVQADANGNWSFDVPTLAEGKHSFIAKTVDEAGNEGSSSDPFTLTVDTTNPLATDAAITEVKDAVAPHEGNIATGGLTNDARPVISGTAVDGITLVRLYDGNTLLGEVSVTNGEWSFRPESALSDGVHNFRVKAVDAAGNEGPHSSTWSVTVDTTAPNAPAITMVYDDVNAVQGNVADGKSTDDRKPTLSGGNAEAGSTVKIYDKGVLIGETVADSKGVWSFTPESDLADGAHVFTVTATDKAGNESVPSASWTITVDLSVPETPKILQIWDDTNPGIGPVGKGETTNDTTPTLSGSAAAGTVVKIFVNGELLGETVATAANTWSYTGFVSDGTHTFTVQSVNAVGTASALSEPFMIIVSTAVPGTPSITTVLDDVGPITDPVKNGKSTDDTRPEIQGEASPNAKINIYDNGALLGTATADATGKWTFTPTTDLADGNHAFTAKIVDGAGVEGQPSFPYVIIVDTTAPDAPRFTVGYDAVGPVIGEFSDGAIINDNRPKLSGAGAEPNAVVTIYKDGVEVATVKSDAGGQWSWKATDALADGTYTFTAKTTDTAGNVSDASDNFTVTIDTVPPEKPVITSVYDDQEPIVANVAKDGFTNDTTPTISGSGAEANGTIRIYDGTTLIGEVTANASGVWSYIPVNPLSNGPHTFTVVAVDAAGNVSEKSDPYKVTVDTLAPSAPSITNVVDAVGPVTGTVNNGKSTDDTKPRLSGSGAESGSVVKVYDNGTLIGQTIANANGTWSFTPSVALTEGAHNFTVTATDQAGNESGESIAWAVIVDLTPPSKPEITAVYDDVAPGIGNVPSGTATNDPTPTLNGKGDAGTTIRIYEGADLLGETTVRANGTWSFTAPLQEDGLRTFTVTSVDEAGNVSATSNSWSVIISTIPPEIPKIEYLYNNNGAENINIPNTNVTNDQDPLLTGTSQPGLVIRIYDNGALVGSTTADADGNWAFNFKTANVKLSEGYHSISVAAVNELGFEGGQSFPRIVTIDITPPPPPAITSAADDVGSIINSNMLSGSLTDDTLPSFRGTTDAYHVIKLYRDGGILVGQAIADGTGNWVIQLTEPLESKTHNFYATATDPAGNVSTSYSNTFKLTVDAIAPDAPVITRIVDNVPDHTGTIEKGGLTNDPAPRVEGTGEANATINIYAGSLLVGTVKANSSGAWSLKLPEGLPDGSYVITATATDLAGNIGPASEGYTIVVDTRAPDVPRITHIVDDVEGHVGNIENRQTTNDNLPLIVGTGEKGTTIAVYDNGNYLGTTVVGADGSWSYQVVRVLGDGTHKFTSTATDPAGNTTGLSNTLEIIIDTVAPNSPRIDDAYDSELGRTMSSGTYTKDKTPTLRGTAEAYSIVEIFDDVYGVIGTTTANGSGGWSFTLPESKGLPDGIYNFKARATDLAGNTGPAMSTGFRLIIDTVPPVAPLIEQVIDAVAGGIVGNIPSNGLTNDTYPTLTGKAEAGTTLTFYGGPNGTSTLGTLVVPANGVWTFKTSYLSNGEHKFVVKSVDAAGNETYSKAPYVITVDSTAPSIPVLTSVYDSTQPVVGNISSNGWTNETKPTFQGTAEAGATLTITHNNVEVGTVQVGPDGKWTWKPTTDLKDGSNTFTFKATDAAGNTSGTTSTFYINVDTVPPVAPEITRIYDNVTPITGDVPKDGYTNDATPTIYVTAEAYSTVIIYDNGVEVARTTLGNTTSWNWTPSQNISEGDHVYTVKQIDRAGQESPLSEPWKIIVDLLAPPAPVILQVWDDVDLYTGAIEQGKLTNDDQPTISGTGIAGTKVTIYANGNAVGTVIVGDDGKWSLTTTRLSNGVVLLTARAEDQAGNQSVDSNSWAISVDTSAPQIARYTSDYNIFVASTHDETKPTFTFERSITANQLGVTAFAMLDGKIIATADVDPVTGKFTLNVPFAETKGWNKYQFGVMDEAGNIEFWRNSQLVPRTVNSSNEPYDLKENEYFYINNSAGPVDKPLIFHYTEGVGLKTGVFLSDVPTDAKNGLISGFSKYVPGSKIEIYDGTTLLGSQNVGTGGNWSYTYSNLAEGVHNITVVYVAPDGTKSAPSDVFKLTIDLTPPDIPEITEIIADEGLYAGVVAKNGQTNDRTLELKGKTEPYATVRIYNGSTQVGEAKADKNGNWSFKTSSLSDGTHTFRTLGLDAAGNLGTLDLTQPGYVITVDTRPPAAPAINDAIDDVGSITGSVKSDGVTDDTKPLLQGTAEYGSTVRIYGTDGKTIIGTAVADATTGKWAFQIPTDLAEGKHTFTAEAIDKAGNVGPKSAVFNITVDTTAPDAPKITRVVDDVAPKLDDLVSGDSTNDTRPTFYGTAEANSTVRVYVGGVEIGTAKADASGNWNFTPAADKALTEGTHVVTFKAMDAAGNLSATAASFTVKVDLTPPAKPELNQIIDAVGIETGPVSNNGTTDDSRPTFKGKGEAGGIVSIMDNGKLLGTTTVAADGTWSFRPGAAMTIEAHTITVTVADAAGNVSVASDPWKITLIRPAGGEPQGFAARSSSDEAVADDVNDTHSHASPMSLDMSGLLAELDVQDGQNFDQSSYAANDNDDLSILAGLINLAEAGSYMTETADHSAAMDEGLTILDVAELADELFDQQTSTEAEEIDLSSLPEQPADPVEPAADTVPVADNQDAASDAYTPPSSSDQDLERLLQQSATQF